MPTLTHANSILLTIALDFGIHGTVNSSQNVISGHGGIHMSVYGNRHIKLQLVLLGTGGLGDVFSKNLDSLIVTYGHGGHMNVRFHLAFQITEILIALMPSSSGIIGSAYIQNVVSSLGGSQIVSSNHQEFLLYVLPGTGGH